MRYSIGIDLGTTNSELSYCLLDHDGKVICDPEALKIPQFVEPSIIESRSVLPSSLYIALEDEYDPSIWALPWDSNSQSLEGKDSEVVQDRDCAESSREGTIKRAKGLFKKVFGIGLSSAGKSSGTSESKALYLVGEIASRRAVDFPGRVVSSAKSWLTCARLDRRQPILPWGAPESVPKVSPVEASQRYLRHLVLAWNHAFPEFPIFDQQVVLTVPASFDESARELTREAAGLAGLNLDTLLFLEEPQAALYAWLARMGTSWRKELAVDDVVLVCDVGGGTTDLSLIRVESENGDLVLRRLAVGRRLLLGGDNIDLALAHRAAELFAEQGVKLNPWQTGTLWRQCREAKELLLSSESDDESCNISILGRSSKLVGDSTSICFPKKDAVSIALEGFFPFCALTERPKRRSGLGLRESGLPYEVDPAITKHIASFLSSQKDESTSDLIKPTRFLLNGGVFNSQLIATRFQQQLDQWFPESKPKNLLPLPDFECAVARGAAFYGAVKHTGGVRIRSASARSYYVGVETSAPAIPGVPNPLKALCVAPIGMEEGSECDVPSEPFELVVGESATFRFFSSTTRTSDQPGSIVDLVDADEQSVSEINDADLQETDPIETQFDADAAGGLSLSEEPEYVAVCFRSKITELGIMEIWCDEVGGSRSWKLEFNVREEEY